MLVLDAVSSEVEFKLVASSRRSGEPLPDGFGSLSVRRICILRDLAGFKLEHALSSRDRVSFIKRLIGEDWQGCRVPADQAPDERVPVSPCPRVPMALFCAVLSGVQQVNYPLIADHSFFLNTPPLFSLVWGVLRSALSAHTRYPGLH